MDNQKHFYRYVSREYASLDGDSGYDVMRLPNPKLILETYNVWKETPKGVWIGYGLPSTGKLRGNARWVSNNGKKRYAYPSKEMALEDFILRCKKRIKILVYNKFSTEKALGLAENQLNKIK